MRKARTKADRPALAQIVEDDRLEIDIAHAIQVIAIGIAGRDRNTVASRGRSERKIRDHVGAKSNEWSWRNLNVSVVTLVVDPLVMLLLEVVL